jgi:hypothetical protein
VATLVVDGESETTTELADSVVDVVLWKFLPGAADPFPKVSNVPDSLSGVDQAREILPHGVVHRVQIGTGGAWGAR